MGILGNKPQGAYDYLRDYSYPFIRDALFVLVNDVFDGDDRLNENMDLRGWAVLYPRSKKDAELLKCVLSNYKVKFEDNDDVIKFKYGQSSRIDDTVRMMANDLSHRNANEILRAAMRQVPLNQLKEMIVKISKTSGGTYGEYVDLYFPTDKSELADDLLQALGVYCTDSYVSRVNGKETKVLRYNSPMPEYVRDVFDELEQRVHARQVQNHVEHDEEVNDGKLNNPVQMVEVHDPEAEKKREQYVNDRKQALSQLKEMITNIEEVQSAGGRQSYFYFYFPDDKIDLADELLQKLDVYAEKHISHLDGIETTVLRYPSTMIPGYFIQVYDELKKALRVRKAKGALARVTAVLIGKNAALEQVKKEITGFAWVSTGGFRYLYFTFPTDFMTEGQELLRTLGISTEYHISHVNDSVEGIPVLRMVVPTAKDAIWNVLYELRDAAIAKRLPNTLNRGGRQGM